MDDTIPEEAIKEFASCLLDRVFVDYFNVFLSLPIFSQKLIYKFDDRDFEFDPPLKKTAHVLGRQKLIKWLLRKRMPFFRKSSLFREYLLCKDILATEIHLSDSSRRSDYDATDKEKERALIGSYIGHVLGMCKLGRYLAGTPGEHALEFCKDVDLLRRSRTYVKKKELFRVMQLKYFRPGGLLCAEDPSVWAVLSDSESALKEEIMAACSWTPAPAAPPPTTLEQLHLVMRRILKFYWIPRYILHCRATDDMADKGDTIKVKNLPDLNVLKHFKDIDRILAISQGNLKQDKRTQVNKARISWHALFPEEEVHATPSEGHTAPLSPANDLRGSPSEGHTVPMSPENDLSGSPSDPTLSRASTAECPSPALSDDEDVTSYMQGGTETSVEPEPPVVTATEQDDENQRSLLYSMNHRSMLELDQEGSPTIPRETMSTPVPRVRIIPVPRICVTNSHTLECAENASTGRPRSHSSPALYPSCTPDPKLGESASERPCKGKPTPVYPGVCSLPPIERNPAAQEWKYPAYRKVFSINPITVTPDPDEETIYKDHNYAIMAFISEDMAGRPLSHFLKTLEEPEVSESLSFWIECTRYLGLQDSLASFPDLTEHLCYRRAHVFVLRRLMPYSSVKVDLPHEIRAELIRLLPQGKGRELLKKAHGIVTKDLAPYWQQFSRMDQADFNDTVMTTRPNKRLPPNSELRTRENSVPIITPIGGQQDYLGVSDRRMLRALQLAMFTQNLDPECVNLEALPIEELEYECETQEGSLALKKLQVIKRLDIERERFQELQRARQARSRALSRQKAAELSRVWKQQALLFDDKPYYSKPIRRDGQWIMRPLKPKAFIDVLKIVPEEKEFFRRYLKCRCVDVAIQFYDAVEEASRMENLVQQQTAVNQIAKKFFVNPTRCAHLNQTVEVVLEIRTATMHNVPLAMLTAVQPSIAKMIETKWFPEYLETFTEAETRQVTPEDGEDRKWTKEKTRVLWKTFCKDVSRFRRGILDKNLSKKFAHYLTLEKLREMKKHKDTGFGVPIRKSIKHKIVDMTKLVADLEFLAECERYGILCDNITHSALAGTSVDGDEDLLELKARSMLDCYIESHVQPKIQINIGPEIAAYIVDNYKNGKTGHGLFHKARMTILPVMCILWNQFAKWQLAMMFPEEPSLHFLIGDNTGGPNRRKSKKDNHKGKRKREAKKPDADAKKASQRKRKQSQAVERELNIATPNYLAMNMNEALITKSPMAACTRYGKLKFSLSEGIKIKEMEYGGIDGLCGLDGLVNRTSNLSRMSRMTTNPTGGSTLGANLGARRISKGVLPRMSGDNRQSNVSLVPGPVPTTPQMGHRNTLVTTKLLPEESETDITAMELPLIQ